MSTSSSFRGLRHEAGRSWEDFIRAECVACGKRHAEWTLDDFLSPYCFKCRRTSAPISDAPLQDASAMLGAAFEYVPRNAESTVLYGVVASELETFLARQQARERPVPKFVEDEFRAFLDCGVLARGFIRVRCESCGHDRLVPYSCKRRGWCASCGGRRMAETAAYLVDHVFPIAAVRQWVLSVPFALRYRLAYDPSLLSAVLNVFIRVVFGDLRRQGTAGDIVHWTSGSGLL